MSLIAAMIGRILLGALFILSGIQKLSAPAATATYIQNMTTLPGSLAVPTGVFEVIAGGLLAIGLMSRLVAILLAVFTALTIFFFHNQFTDPEQGVQALKNVALIGGLLMVFAYSQMRASTDIIELERRNELAARDAELRAHAAELKAARAEGRADGLAEDGLVQDEFAQDRPAGTEAPAYEPVPQPERRRPWWRY